MKMRGKIALAIAGLSFAIAANAIVNDGSNPYQPIVERNVFGLKDPPPPPSPDAEKPPPAKITLTGISTILGRKQALLEWTEPPTPGQQPKKNYSILTEGQREGQIEVLQIDEKAGMVKVRNYGVAQTLNFEQNGPKLPSSPITPLPGAGGIPSPTAAIPAPMNAGGAFSPAPSVPSATAASSGTVVIGGGAANPNASGLKQIPSRQLRLPTTATQSQQPNTQAPQQPALSAEQQILLMDIEDAVAKETPPANKYNIPPPPLPTEANLVPAAPPVPK
jgi:hypothetical protein